MIKVSLISLGCAKNLVDSEIMVGHLHKAGMQVIPEAEKADVVIVNTCSFLNASKEESIATILEANEQRGMRKRRKEQKLIVAGCMSQRFFKELPGAMPEVDAFIGLDQVTKVAPIIEELYAKERGAKALPENFAETVTRIRTLAPENPLGLYYGGLVARAEGDSAAAKEMWLKVLALIPEGSAQRDSLQREIDSLSQ